PQNPVPLAELALGEQYVQPAYPGNQLGFAAGGAWVGEPYVVTGEIGQVLGFDEARSFVAYVDDEGSGNVPTGPGTQPQNTGPQTSGTPTTVDVVIINEGFDSLSIAAIDDPQNPVPLAELALGEQYVQPAYPGNQLGFAAGGAWVGQPYVVTGEIGQVLGFDETRSFVAYVDDEQSNNAPTGSGTQSQSTGPQTSGTPTTVDVVIINEGFETLSVAAIDDPQNPVALADLALGEQYVQPAYPGNQLGFAAGGAWVGQPYVVSAEIGQVIGFDETRGFVAYVDDEEQGNAATGSAKQPQTTGRQTSGTPTTVDVVIINEGFDSLSVAAIDDPQNPVALAELARGQQYTQPAYPGNQLGFAAGGKWVGQAYTVTADVGQVLGFDETQSFVAYIDENVSQAPVNSEPLTTVTVLLNNDAYELMTIAAIDDPENPIALIDLPFGARFDQEAYPGNVLGFLVNNNWLDDAYQVTNANGQVVNFAEGGQMQAFVDDGTFLAQLQVREQQPLQREQGPNDAMARFINTTSSTITVSLIPDDPNGTPEGLFEIPAGGEVSDFAPKGSTLGFYSADRQQYEGENYVMLDFSGETVQIPWRDPNSRDITVTNSAAYPLTVLALAESAEGQPDALVEIPAYGSQTFSIKQNTRIQAYDMQSQTFDGGEYLVRSDPSQGLTIPVRASGSVEVVMTNTSSDELGAQKVFTDPNREAEFLTVIRAGQNARIYPFPGETISFANLNTNEWIGGDFTVQSNPVQTISLPLKGGDTDGDGLVSQAEIQTIASKIAQGIAAQQLELMNQPDRCWRNSYGRGVGKIPNGCRASHPDKEAGLCYQQCGTGYTGFAATCVQDCPSTVIDGRRIPFTSDGLVSCIKPPPYTRSAFVWKLGDTLFSLDDARARCARSKDGKQYGCVTANENTIVYSGCPSGMKTAPLLTNLCTPVCPLGMTDSGIGCFKNNKARGVGLIPDECGANRKDSDGNPITEYDAGLCYKQCEAGYNGVGPVCWGQCPRGWVNCGAGCARDSNSCAMMISDQISSPLMVAGNTALIALTAGGAAAGTAAANAGKAAAKTAASTATKLAARTAAKAGIRAKVRAILKAGLSQSIRAGGKAVAKDLAMDTAISAALVTTLTNVTDSVQREQIKEAVRQQVIQELEKGISDEQIDAAIEIAMEGADQNDGIANNFPWESLDPTGVAEVVVAYNNPLCATIKTE
ncbi:MAG: hypothetical protein ABJ349_08415, partial [Hyphomicrobiales bacterium]